MSLLIIIVVGVAFVEPVAVVSYERDIWHHLSVYRELIASPFHAANPHVATLDPSRSYSPWTVSVALLARSAGLDQFGAISISAVGSITLILVGVFLFARHYWQHAAAPFVLLIALFGTWIVQIDHTGYTTIRTTLFSIGYPYAPAIGMGFIGWWMALCAIKTEKRTWLWFGLLAGLSLVVFVTHQLQGLFAIGMMGAFLLFASGQTSWKKRLILATSLAAGLIASQWWWYFDPIAYVLDPRVQTGHDAVRFLSYSLDQPGRILWVLGFALLGLFGFVSLSQRKVRLDLLLPFIVLVGGFVFLLGRESWVSVRVLPFIALVLQLGLVSYLVGPTTSRLYSIARFTTLGLLCISLAWGALVGGSAYQRAQKFLNQDEIVDPPKTWSSQILDAAAYGENLVPEGSVAIAHLQTAFPIEATSLSVVAIPRLFAEVPDMLERQSDNSRFFDAHASLTERCTILSKYDVALIVWRDVWIDPEAEQDLLRLGERTRFADLSFIAAQEDGFSACASNETRS